MQLHQQISLWMTIVALAVGLPQCTSTSTEELPLADPEGQTMGSTEAGESVTPDAGGNDSSDQTSKEESSNIGDDSTSDNDSDNDSADDSDDDSEDDSDDDSEDESDDDSEDNLDDDSNDDENTSVGCGTASTPNLHVLLRDGSAGRLKYFTRNSSGTWASVEVDTGRTVTDGALAIDGPCNAHVSYGNVNPGSSYGIYYKTNAVKAFDDAANMPEQAFADTNEKNLSAIAIANNGTPHIVTNRYASLTYTYVDVTKSGGTWTPTTVIAPSPSVPGAFFNIRHRPDDSMIMQVTPLQSGSPIRSATYGSAWNNVSTITTVGGTMCVAAAHKGDADLNSANIGFITYLCSAMGGITHVGFATNAGGSWVTSSVTAGSSDSNNIPSAPRLAIDTSDVVHLIYFQQGLQYRTYSGGIWSTATMIAPNDPGIGAYAVTATDSSHVYVVYMFSGELRAIDVSGPLPLVPITVTNSLGSDSTILGGFVAK